MGALTLEVDQTIISPTEHMTFEKRYVSQDMAHNRFESVETTLTLTSGDMTCQSSVVSSERVFFYFAKAFFTFPARSLPMQGMCGVRFLGYDFEEKTYDSLDFAKLSIEY